jgi:hypothetical protein
MLLREAQSPMYYDQEGQIQGGGQLFVYQPFTTTDLLNGKHHIPSFTEKPQALIDLMQSIIQTHKHTWTDCRQVLLTLFNTEEQCRIMLAALKWLEGHAPEGTQNTQAYAQTYFPEEDLHCDPNNGRDYQQFERYQRTLLGGMKAGENTAINVNKASEAL